MKSSWRPYLPFIFLAGVAAVQLLCVPGQYLGKEDGALYVLASRSILQGHYTLGVSPGSPPLTFLTPGWPLLLTPAALVSGDSPAGYQLWSWGWLALCDLLLLLWLRRRLGWDAAACGLTALFALNPLVLSRAGAVMSELPFLAAALGLLLLLEGGKRAPGWVSGLLLGAAWLIRPAALPLFPAVWGAYLVEKRWKDVAGAVLASLLPVALWQLWTASAGAGLAETEELSITLFSVPFSEWGRIALRNALEAGTLTGRSLLPWVSGEGSVLAMVLGGGVLAAGAAGHLLRLRRRGYDAAGAFLLLSLGMHAFWPWWFERYLPPLLPFILLGIWQLTPEPAAARPRTALLLAFLAAAPLPAQGTALVRRAAGAPKPSLSLTYAWIRQNTPGDALFMSALYSRDAYYTGRPFLPPPSLREGRELAAVLRKSGVGFVLWKGVPDLGSSLGADFAWARALRKVGEGLSGPGFERVFSEEAGTGVFRVLPAPTKVTSDSP